MKQDLLRDTCLSLCSLLRYSQLSRYETSLKCPLADEWVPAYSLSEVAESLISSISSDVWRNVCLLLRGGDTEAHRAPGQLSPCPVQRRAPLSRPSLPSLGPHDGRLPASPLDQMRLVQSLTVRKFFGVERVSLQGADGAVVAGEGAYRSSRPASCSQQLQEMTTLAQAHHELGRLWRGDAGVEGSVKSQLRLLVRAPGLGAGAMGGALQRCLCWLFCCLPLGAALTLDQLEQTPPFFSTCSRAPQVMAPVICSLDLCHSPPCSIMSAKHFAKTDPKCLSE